jgi:hypothetical protein
MSNSQARNMRRQLFAEGMMPRRTPRTIYAHEQVVSVARGLAHEVYADIMGADNELYADWKKQCEDLTPEKCEELFVELLVPRLLEPARAMLARMLALPEFAPLHESIYDALCRDNVLRQGRAAPQGRPRLDIGEDGNVKVTRH